MNLNRLLQEESVPYDMLHDASSTTAPEAFVQSMESSVNTNDLSQMMESQTHMLLRFEKTNEMLHTFLSLSAARYTATVDEFNKHTQLMTEMKKDLDSIFKRIRNLKAKLGRQYPKAFAECSDMRSKVLDENEEERGAQALPKDEVKIRQKSKSSKPRPYSTPIEVRIVPTTSESQEHQPDSKEISKENQVIINKDSSSEKLNETDTKEDAKQKQGSNELSHTTEMLEKQ